MICSPDMLPPVTKSWFWLVLSVVSASRSSSSMSVGTAVPSLFRALCLPPFER